MKDVNDLMQAILEMDAAQRKVSEKAKLERTARLAALDEQKQKIIAECDAREKAACEAAAKAAEQGNADALAALEQQCQQAAEAMTDAARSLEFVPTDASVTTPGAISMELIFTDSSGSAVTLTLPLTQSGGKVYDAGADSIGVFDEILDE